MEEGHATFMQQALNMALRSKEYGDMPFGAVVVRGGKVIAAASNSEHRDQDVTRHAEVKAISEASHILGTRDLSDCTIYSTVEPCPMCAGAIFHSCVQRVVYGMARDDMSNLFRSRTIHLWHLAEDWHYTPEIIGGVLKQEVMETFADYTKPFRVIPAALTPPAPLDIDDALQQAEPA